MRLGNDKVQIIPFEPTHANYFYKWQLLSKYKNFFGNLELTSLHDWSQLKNAFMIIDPKEPSKVLGAFLLQQIDTHNRNLVINVLVDEMSQKNGIATEAGKYMLWYVFNQMNYYKVMGKCSESAQATLKIFEKLGFKKEAHFKNHVVIDGEREDVLQFYVIKGPFNRQFGEELRSGTRKAVAAA